jgi:lysophospholipase L1-like esterase
VHVASFPATILPVVPRPARLLSGAAAALAAQALWTVVRPLPRFEEFDASGEEGSGDGPLLHLVVLGDSTTTGPGVAGPEEIWIRVLARRLAAGRRVKVTSVARGGATAALVRREQLAPAVAAGGDVAFVSIGANDALRGVPVRSFERDLSAVADALARNAGMVVLSGVGDLGTIPRLHPPLRQLARARGRRLNEAHLRVAARSGAVVADQWSAGTADPFRYDPSVYSADLFHPTAAGHEVWAETAYRTIEPHLPFSRAEHER